MTPVRAGLGRQATDLIRLTSRFGLAGLANTALGFGIIAGLELGFGVQRHLANAIGYGVGMLLGYVLNRSFVFRNEGSSRTRGMKYVIALAAAFGLNQFVLSAAGAMLGDSSLERLAAQFMAIASYTISLFVLLRMWVFRPAKT
jgi:putative flippase GtrA